MDILKDVELTLERTGGLTTRFSVPYRAFQSEYDSIPVQEEGSVTFLPDQTTATITLDVPAAVLGQASASTVGNFTVALQQDSAALQGAGIGAANRASVTVVLVETTTTTTGGNVAGPAASTSASSRSCTTARASCTRLSSQSSSWNN